MRFDELTAQKYGITVETLDLSDFFLRMKSVDASSPEFAERLIYYKDYANCANVPEDALENMVRASVAADKVAAELGTDCMTIRFWDSFSGRCASASVRF